jgi:hypothetical protein
MKTKKRWSWTEKQRRRHTRGRYHHWSNVPNHYVKKFIESNRTKEKRDVKKVMLGFDPDKIDFSPRYQKRCARWFYL